ncbi:unnamed protein product [Echinostoma caproni]|uniref:adenylate cyclase n=1 Tax=Echinostoma caproni TaxID=27848 RepID=A0A183BCH3_9TREM|nr:unnamed protein product [Echinostoma caproni]
MSKDDTVWGEQVRDVFLSNSYAEASIKTKFSIILRTLFQVVNQEFSTIGQFYEEVSIRHLVRRLRAGIRLTLIYSLIGITEIGVMQGEVSATRIVFVLIVILSSVIFYCCSARMTTPGRVFNSSFLIILQNMALSVLLAADDSEPQLAGFMTGVMLLVALCLLLPVRYDLVVVLLVLYASAYLISDWLPAELISSRWVEHRYQTEDEHRVRTTFWVNILIWLTALIGGIQLHVWGILRQKFAFLYLADSVHEYNACLELEKRQILTFKELLPAYFLSKSMVRNSLTESDPISDTFVEQSELQSVITVLDQLSVRVGCEKLDIFGSTYFAYAGLDPVKAQNHCHLCIELGLVMCYMIKRVAHKYKTPLRVRVGVHLTSTIFSALIGHIRPRIDLLSYDMNIVEKLQATGIPGRVRVTELTYQQCKDKFQFAPGDPIELTQPNGELFLMDTYYVHPRSKSISSFRLTPEEIKVASEEAIDRLELIMNRVPNPVNTIQIELENRLRFSVIKSQLQVDESLPRGSYSLDSELQLINTANKPTEQELNQMAVQYLANNIHEAPNYFRTQYLNTPINFWTRCFVQRDVERIYQSQLSLESDRHLLDSSSMIIITDMISLTIHLFLIMLVIYVVIQPSGVMLLSFILLCLVFCAPQITILYLFIQMVMAPTCQDTKPKCNPKFIHKWFVKNVVCEVLLFFQSMTPTLCLLTYMLVFFDNGVHDESAYQLIIALEPLVYMTHIFPSRSRFVTRLCGITISVLIFASVNVYAQSASPLLCTYDRSKSDVYRDQRVSIYLLEIWAIILMTWTGFRENDLICRIVFYQRHERNTQKKKKLSLSIQTHHLISALIPTGLYKCVKAISLMELHHPRKLSAYWTESLNAGVAHIGVINFRRAIQSDDTQKTIRQIKTLHLLICALDQLLANSSFGELDKIKSWQHYYVVCSGLFSKQTRRSTDLRAHLVALMEYCLLVLHQLNEFNNLHFPDSDGFKLAIGYHTGAIYAGISGSVRMTLNTWGDTVRLAHTLMQQEVVNQIVVHEATTLLLSHLYEFQPCGQLILNTGYPEVNYIPVQMLETVKKNPEDLNDYPTKPTVITENRTFVQAAADVVIAHEL